MVIEIQEGAAGGRDQQQQQRPGCERGKPDREIRVKQQGQRGRGPDTGKRVGHLVALARVVIPMVLLKLS